jgi:hypothetical protein
MSNFPSPVGAPTYFEGDILQFINSPFGFFEVEVTAPDTLNRPLLQTKVKTKGGLRTVAPLGTWTDWIFSEEMKAYESYGYEFKILRGYFFEKCLIFKHYIDDLYQIKQSYSNKDPMYLIAKLLMNSLYGRFGMAQELPEHIILSNQDIENLSSNNKISIIDIIDLHNGKSLVSITNNDPNKEELLEDSNKDINISIAAAVTAYSRIHMSKYLGDPSLNICYTDTDGFYTTTPLPDS